jgi:hypothetical protein
MVGFCQVDQLEVESEGARKQNGALHGQRMHQFQRRGGLTRGFFIAAAGLGVAPADGALAQRLHVGK